MAGEVESLQLAEDRGAQVVLHVERDAPAANRRMYASTKSSRPRPTSSDEQRPERLVGRDDVVDDRAFDERHGSR